MPTFVFALELSRFCLDSSEIELRMGDDGSRRRCLPVAPPPLLGYLAGRILPRRWSFL